MQINPVTIGNQALGNSFSGNSTKADKEASETQQLPAPQYTQKSDGGESFYEAADISALHNKFLVSRTKETNPADYLSEERMSDIDAMMAEFESGVNNIADVIRADFPEISEDQALALAAETYAREF